MASRSARERLLQHLEASQGLRMALETYRIKLRSAIWPKKACRRVAGWPLGHTSDTFFKPVGAISIEKRQNYDCIDFSCIFAANAAFPILYLILDSCLCKK